MLCSNVPNNKTFILIVTYVKFNDYLPGFLPFSALQLGQQTNFSSPTLSEVTMTKMLGHEYQRFFTFIE